MAAVINVEAEDVGDFDPDGGKASWLRRVWLRVAVHVARWASRTVNEACDVRIEAERARHDKIVAVLNKKHERMKAERDTAKMEAEAFTLMHLKMVAALTADTAAYKAAADRSGRSGI